MRFATDNFIEGVVDLLHVLVDLGAEHVNEIIELGILDHAGGGTGQLAIGTERSYMIEGSLEFLDDTTDVCGKEKVKIGGWVFCGSGFGAGVSIGCGFLSASIGL